MLRFLLVTATAFLLPSGIHGQAFGLGNRGGGGGGGMDFEAIQAQAKRAAAGLADGGGLAGLGSLDEMQKLLSEAFQDPEALKYLENMGHNLEQAMQQLKDMTPEDLQESMKEAMNVFADPDMMEQVLANKEQVLAQLEATKAVPAEELAKLRADPEYYEQQMRKSFSEMQGLMQDPKLQEMVAGAMEGMQQMLDKGMSGDFMEELAQLMGVDAADLTSDEVIEETRLELLKMGTEGADNAVLAEFMSNDQIKALAQDPVAFRESVKEGYKLLKMGPEDGGRGAKSQGAGIGEL